jgi:hypothetical protein
MKTQTIKKEVKINKNGWMPFLIISAGLIILIFVLKLVFALLEKSPN